MLNRPDPSADNQTDNRNENRNHANENDLIRQVAARVWELWQQELRLERERRGGMRR
ncbi:MAG: hypothetical protein K8J31_18765 [Anaerolineae bacterium]|nr:hypothetical protein [Anaerolineae bacterium]